MDKFKQISQTLLRILVGGTVIMTVISIIFLLGDYITMLIMFSPFIVLSYLIGNEILSRYKRKDKL